MSDPLELISAYLDHDLSEAELAELEAWIVSSPENPQIFARRAMLHSHVRDAMAGALSLRVSQLRSPELFDPIEGSLDDAIIMDALTDSPPASAPLIIAPDSSPATEPIAPLGLAARVRPSRYWRFGGAAAAIVLLAVGTWCYHMMSARVAQLTAVADLAWNPGEPAPEVGETLSNGKTLRLGRGLAELHYLNGAQVVLQGPAEIVLNSRQELTLLHGRLTARVPGAAHGFTVTTPAGQIVDLGTEFGVNVVSDTAVETQVFVGKIEVQPKKADGQPPLLVTAGQAATMSDSTVTTAAPFTEDQFVRDIHRVFTRFPTYSTGVGLEAGDEDPHWMITSLPDQPAAKPKPAQVSDTLGFYTPDDERSLWVSTLAELPQVSAGRYTFSTTFDLTGFDPKTARLHLFICADDYVAELRINGHVIPVQQTRGATWYHSANSLEIDSNFLPGINHLDVVVFNVERQMGLKAELYGTAVRTVDEP
jgi:hypothetical protein